VTEFPARLHRAVYTTKTHRLSVKRDSTHDKHDTNIYRWRGCTLDEYDFVAQAAVIGTKPWTRVGASGTAVSGQTDPTGHIAYLASTSTSAVIIYNVVAVDGLQATSGTLPTHPVMKARFRDNGANNRIIFRLKRMDLNSGAVSTVLTLDSDNFAGSSGFQTREVGCGNSFTFDFSNHA
jgi:hypothetical protein